MGYLEVKEKLKEANKNRHQWLVGTILFGVLTGLLYYWTSNEDSSDSETFIFFQIIFYLLLVVTILYLIGFFNWHNKRNKLEAELPELKRKSDELEKKNREQSERNKIEREKARKEEAERRRIADEKERERRRIANEKKKQRIEEKTIWRDDIIKKLDKDGNRKIDIAEADDFGVLLQKREQQIIEIDKEYILKFVQLAAFLKTKRQYLQEMFFLVAELKDDAVLDSKYYAEILENKIHSYEQLLFHSISMLTSLLENKLIVFNQIYLVFDKLKVFYSDHQNEMLKSINETNSQLVEVNKGILKVNAGLSKVNSNLSELIHKTHQMEMNIVSELGNLSYTTESAFQDLNNSIGSQLQSIDSSINTNTMLNGIQTYQLHKISKKLG
jgi:hypothetical protein